MAKQASDKQNKRNCGICKYPEPLIAKELPGCEGYSIRMRPNNLPKNDINYADWNIVSWNIEKKSLLCQITAVGDTREEAIKAIARTFRFGQTVQYKYI